MNKGMCTLGLAVLAALLFVGCATTTKVPLPSAVPPAKLSALAGLSVSPYASLKAQIDSVLPDTLFPPSNVGIKVVSLSRKETLYDLNGEMLFNPASNQKLFTSATALSKLGEAFPLATVVYADTGAQTIHVQGFGDPILATRDLDSLAAIVASKLPVKKTWKIVGDMSYFDDWFLGPGWTWDEEPAAYGMFVTPLVLNGNTITVNVRAGKKHGEPVVVSVDPPTDFVSVENTAVTVGDSVTTPLDIGRKWREHSNVITVSGQLHMKDRNSSAHLSMWQPERYALKVFAEMLVAKGVHVGGVEVDSARGKSFEIGSVSHRLDSIVTYLNKESDNLSAECLLKSLAAQRTGGPGSWHAGTTVVMEFLSALGIDTVKISIVDGSGLSRYNLTSPAVVIRLLEHMYASAHYDAFAHSLPIAGVDGTIGRRMKGTAAEGNLRAKTGTLSGVTALSGYVTTADGEPLAFSILMQNFATNPRLYRLVQDSIGAILGGLRRFDLQ